MAEASLTTRQAAFIGVGAMVGAGIFSLLGAAGEVAGSAVWLSFLIAGIVAMLQGYSFAFFDLSSIASIGSAIALMVFTLVSVAHVRARDETGANLALLVTAIGATVSVLIAFALTTLVDEPGTAVAIVVITALSIVLDLVTKRRSAPTSLEATPPSEASPA